MFNIMIFLRFPLLAERTANCLWFHMELSNSIIGQRLIPFNLSLISVKNKSKHFIVFGKLIDNASSMFSS